MENELSQLDIVLFEARPLFQWLSSLWHLYNHLGIELVGKNDESNGKVLLL